MQAVAGEWVDAQLQMVNNLKEEAMMQMSDLTGDPKLATDLLQQAWRRTCLLGIIQ